MKKGTLLNASLSTVIAQMGHTDRLVISDAGLPVPEGVARIDLAVSPGLPPFLEVLRAVLAELEVESVVIAEELEEVSPEMYAALMELLGEIPVKRVPHETFKAETSGARAIARTGEFTPYANVILSAGVVF